MNTVTVLGVCNGLITMIKPPECSMDCSGIHVYRSVGIDKRGDRYRLYWEAKDYGEVDWNNPSYVEKEN